MLKTASVTISLFGAALAASRRSSACDVAVRIALHDGTVRLGQLHGVDDRGMVEAVGKDRVAAAGEGRRHREVGEVAGGEGQRAREAGEGGEFRFERFMRREVAADQVRSAAARAPASRAVGQRRGDLRVAGQPEIVVAGEIEHFPPSTAAMRPHGDSSTRRRRVRPAAAMSASSAVRRSSSGNVVICSSSCSQAGMSRFPCRTRQTSIWDSCLDVKDQIREVLQRPEPQAGKIQFVRVVNVSCTRVAGDMRVSMFQDIDEAEGCRFGSFAQVMAQCSVNIPIGLFARDELFCPHRPVCWATRARKSAK